MISNKNKKFLFFAFYKFFVFCKKFRCKKTKNWNFIKFLIFFQFSQIFSEISWIFLKKNPFFRFFEKFQENRPKFGIFSFFTDILVILFLKIWIYIIISRNKSAEIFLLFFVFCSQKTPFFFVFCKKSNCKKKP